MIKGRVNIDFNEYKILFKNVKTSNETYGNTRLKNTDVAIVFPMYENVELVKILLISLLEVQKLKKEKIEIVVVDNFSSNKAKSQLKELASNIEKKYNFDFQINLVLQSSSENYSIIGGYQDSIMNAYGLHVGYESIKTTTEYVFVCHSDVMFINKNWFSFLKENSIANEFAIAGFRNYNREIEYAHVCGYMFKTKYFSKANIDFFPVYNKDRSICLDVGDKLSDICRDKKLKIFLTKNTFNKNVDIEKIDPLFQNYSFDVSVDDKNNAIFLHLGRGARKSLNMHSKQDKKNSFDDWREMFYLLFRNRG